jgi:hypothetical protein
VIVIVDEEPDVTDDGEKLADAPLGSPLAPSATDCALPDVIAVETLALVLEPAATLPEVGLTAIEKSFVPDEAGPNAATPFGVPSPVGPSYPTSAVHRYAGEQLAVEPLVTSKSAPGLAYGYWFGYAFDGGDVAIA